MFEISAKSKPPPCFLAYFCLAPGAHRPCRQGRSTPTPRTGSRKFTFLAAAPDESNRSLEHVKSEAEGVLMFPSFGSQRQGSTGAASSCDAQMELMEPLSKFS